MRPSDSQFDSQFRRRVLPLLVLTTFAAAGGGVCPAMSAESASSSLVKEEKASAAKTGEIRDAATSGAAGASPALAKQPSIYDVWPKAPASSEEDAGDGRLSGAVERLLEVRRLTGLDRNDIKGGAQDAQSGSSDEGHQPQSAAAMRSSSSTSPSSPSASSASSSSASLLDKDGKFAKEIRLRLDGPSRYTDENGRPLSHLQKAERDAVHRQAFEILKSQGYSWEEHKKRLEDTREERWKNDPWRLKNEETLREIREHGPITTKVFVRPGLTPEQSEALDHPDNVYRRINGKWVIVDGRTKRPVLENSPKQSGELKSVRENAPLVTVTTKLTTRPARSSDIGALDASPVKTEAAPAFMQPVTHEVVVDLIEGRRARNDPAAWGSFPAWSEGRPNLSINDLKALFPDMDVDGLTTSTKDNLNKGREGRAPELKARRDESVARTASSDSSAKEGTSGSLSSLSSVGSVGSLSSPRTRESVDEFRLTPKGLVRMRAEKKTEEEKKTKEVVVDGADSASSSLQEKVVKRPLMERPTESAPASPSPSQPSSQQHSRLQILTDGMAMLFGIRAANAAEKEINANGLPELHLDIQRALAFPENPHGKGAASGYPGQGGQVGQVGQVGQGRHQDQESQENYARIAAELEADARKIQNAVRDAKKTETETELKRNGAGYGGPVRQGAESAAPEFIPALMARGEEEVDGSEGSEGSEDNAEQVSGTVSAAVDFAADIVHRTTGSLTRGEYEADAALLASLLSRDGDEGKGGGSFVGRAFIGELQRMLRNHPEVLRIAPDTQEKLGELARERFGIENDGEKPVADDPRGSVTYVFLSRSLGERELKRIFEEASFAARRDLVFVFRGVEKGRSINDGILDLQRLAGGLTPIPNIVIDPTLFRNYGVNVVPTVLRAKGRSVIEERFAGRRGEAEEGKRLASGMTGPSEILTSPAEPSSMPPSRRFGAVVARASGLYRDEWLMERIDAGETGDLGERGDVREISEPDLIEVMKARVMEVDWEGKREQAVKNAWKHQTFIELPTAAKSRRRQIDPTILVERDILDLSGRPIRRAGDRVNPLRIQPFTLTLLVFDPTSEEEMRRVRVHLSRSRLMGATPPVLIATRIDREEGWDAYKALTDRFDQHVFILNEDVARTFDLEATPSLVRADNAAHVFIVEELGPLDEGGRTKGMKGTEGRN